MHALSRPIRCIASGVRPRAAAAMRDPSRNPTVGRLRELFRGGGDAADGWEQSWECGITPWDLGKPTPIIEHLVKSGTLPQGRALVPGCGMGYDVVALASPDRFVVGLEISNIATEKAKQVLLCTRSELETGMGRDSYLPSETRWRAYHFDIFDQ